LGNQFLAHIREVDAIIHLVRCFEDSDTTHVEGSIDPIRDMDIINTELMLADLDSLERRQTSLTKKAKTGDKDAKAQLELVELAYAQLSQGQPARFAQVPPDQVQAFKQLHLITAKPVLYVCNVSEAEAATGNTLTAKVNAHALQEKAQSVVISAAIEAEISLLTTESDRAEFLTSLNLTETGLAQVIQRGYALLDLVTFFTVGPKEARAWTVRHHAKVPEAAGVIHTDFEHGFIRAETIAYDDYVNCNGEQGAKAAGKLRLEGKEYLVQDGDIYHFRFNV